MSKVKEYKGYEYSITKASITGYNVGVYGDIEWVRDIETAKRRVKEHIDRLYTLNIPVPKDTACRLSDSFIYQYHKRYECSNAKWSHRKYYNGITGDGKDLPCTLEYISYGRD